MKKAKNSERGQKIWHIFLQYLFILIGSVIYAVGFQFFMYPNSVVSGGLTGISMIINYFTNFPVGIMIIIFNIPLFIVAWKRFGVKFMMSSLTAVVLSSLIVDIFAATGIVLTSDPMLAAIIGGAIKGAGLGVIYYMGATTGGADIVAKMIQQKYPYFNFGTILLLMDAVIIAAYAVILGRYDSAMYSIIAMYVVSKVIDLALYGIDNSSLCYIISENSEELIKGIINGPIRRGVTILEGEGAYSRRHKQIIMCVIKRTQISQMRHLVRTLDERAFFIVTDAKNVFGKGFENIAEVK